ncbi:MAG: DUF58 domain-containing protein [Gammaproteobacteria bacterium]
MLRKALYHNFLAVRRADAFVKRRFTATGRMLLGAVLAGTIFGINTRATLSWQLATMALALLGLAFVLSLRFKPAISLTRSAPRLAAVGETLHYTVEARNAGRRAQRGLEVAERTGGRRLDFNTFAKSRDPRDARRNLFDRYVGYPRFAALARAARGMEAPEQMLPDLRPGAVERFAMSFTPTRRGELSLAGFDLFRPDPLGLFRAHARVAAPASVIITPKRYDLRWRELEGASADRSSDRDHSLTIGAGEEFSSLREYRPGDPLKHIYWRGWARHGKPVVKEFHHEQRSRYLVVLDTIGMEPVVTDAISTERESMEKNGAKARRVKAAKRMLVRQTGFDKPEFEEAVSVAASLVAGADTPSGQVDLAFVSGREPHYLTTGPGNAPRESLLRALALVQTEAIDHGGDDGGADAFNLLVDHLQRERHELGACAMVVLGWRDSHRAMADALMAMGVALRIFCVSPKVGLEPHDAPALAGRLHAVVPGQAAQALAGVGAVGFRAGAVA